MKNKFLTFKIVLLVVSMIFIASCKKDKDEESPPPEFQELTFDKEEVLNTVPVGLKESENEYAEGLYSIIESAVDMSSFINNMTPPDNAEEITLKSSASYKWSWTYQKETYTFYWTFTEDANKYYWDMEIQYNDGPKYKYIEAWETKDGNMGELKFNFNWIYAQYEIEYDIYYWKYTWEKTSSGIYYFDFYVESENDLYDNTLHYSIVLNANGSGTLDYYKNDALFYHYEWDSLGNGSWTYYIGDAIFTGSWTVG